MPCFHRSVFFFPPLIPLLSTPGRRLARMVKTPVVANVTTQLFSFQSPSQVYTHHFSELAGKRLWELPYYFPDATILGIHNRTTGRSTGCHTGSFSEPVAESLLTTTRWLLPD